MAAKKEHRTSPFSGIQLNPWLASTLNPSTIDSSVFDQSGGAVELEDIKHRLTSGYGGRKSSVSQLESRLAIDHHGFVKPPLAEGDGLGTPNGLSTDASIFLQIQNGVEDCHARFVAGLNQAFVAAIGASHQMDSGMELDIQPTVEASRQFIDGCQGLTKMIELHLKSYELLLANLTGHVDNLDLESRPENHTEAKRRRVRVVTRLMSEQLLKKIATPGPGDPHAAEVRKLIVRYLRIRPHGDDVKAFYCWFAKGLTQNEIAGLLDTSQSTVHRIVANRFPDALALIDGFLKIEEQAAQIGLSVKVKEDSPYGANMVFYDSGGDPVLEASLFNLKWPYPIKDVTHKGIYYPGYSSVHDDPNSKVLWVYPATYSDFINMAPSWVPEYGRGYPPSELVPNNNATAILNRCSWAGEPTSAATVILWTDGQVSFHPAGCFTNQWSDPQAWEGAEIGDLLIDTSPESLDDWFNEIKTDDFSDFLNSFEDEPPSLKRFLDVSSA